MIEKEELYPLLFKPVYKEVMWGGANLEKVLHRELPAERKGPIGESWEITDRPEGVSIVANGSLAGTSLSDLVRYFGSDLVGEKYNGGPFPLLVKIIDAGKRLSLQVHPDERACARTPGIEPKTEMWYIIHAEKNAKIIAGLRSDTTKMTFLRNVSGREVEHTLQIFDSVPGDAYFIKAGKVHAIGAGNLLLEIQQNSNTTYRLSDWGRVDENGKSRELHVEQAKDCIDFMDRTVSRISGASNLSEQNRKYPLVKNCPYFQVEELRIMEKWRDSTASTGSFHIITAINGPVRVGRDELVTDVSAGTTCLIPAVFGTYFIERLSEERTIVVKTTL